MKPFTLRQPALLAGFGAMACITLLASLQLITNSTIWLMAPFGATMVIAFGLPGSPLAQPKNIVLGHTLTTLIGLVIASSLGVSPITLGLAVGLAVTLMMVSKTTHPPAGANPLLVMLTGQGWEFILTPVLTGSLSIVLFAWVFHKLVSKSDYPKKQL